MARYRGEAASLRYGRGSTIETSLACANLIPLSQTFVYAPVLSGRHLPAKDPSPRLRCRRRRRRRRHRRFYFLRCCLAVSVKSLGLPALLLMLSTEPEEKEAQPLSARARIGSQTFRRSDGYSYKHTRVDRVGARGGGPKGERRTQGGRRSVTKGKPIKTAGSHLPFSSLNVEDFEHRAWFLTKLVLQCSSG